MQQHVIALDQGTSSTRAIIFDREAREVSRAQLEHRQIFPRPGWVEHDAGEIWRNTRSVVGQALGRAHLTSRDIAAIGITNQRETAVLWERATGRPVANAIVWQDARTQEIVDRLADDGGVDRFRDRVGLPLNTYFAGTKLMWLLEHVPGARERAQSGELLFGTIDTWLLWNLTGGPDGGVHFTDVTNASRTLFMDLRRLDWDDEILEACGVPRSLLPEIRSSSEVYGVAEDRSLLGGVPIAGILGDQQAALFGQAAFRPGDAKNTYGTGSFLLSNTGEEIVHSGNGLLTTVAARLGDQPPTYALEGSIAVTGSLVQWLRDNLGLISSSDEIETLAASVDDTGGCYIVPAFSGLLAPYWRPDARGAIVGLTRYVHRGHIARAALESTAFQTRDVLDACNADSGVPLTELRVDGGMVVNDALMQFQADILGTDVVRPEVIETTALGAAGAAGLATGFWSDPEAFAATWREERRWSPSLSADARERRYRAWRKAVSKSFDWVDEDTAPTS